MYLKLSRSLSIGALISTTLLTPFMANATIVEFQTNYGNFEVNLFDNDTPATVSNFLDYVNSGAYTNTVYHRSAENFVIQGGGFAFDTALQIVDIPTNTAVINEPQFSNVRGTIAMARTTGINSATNQWFFNLGDNSVALDNQNGGFTVFGQVLGNGMDVVDAVAALPTFNFDSPFNELPLRNYTTDDFDNGVVVDDIHLVIVSAIIITDASVDSASTLSPVLNVLVTAEEPSSGGGGGGGGSINIFTLVSLLGLYLFRRKWMSRAKA